MDQSDTSMSSCPICGEEFASEHGVKVHAGRSHNTSLAGETVACTVCGTKITRIPYEIQEYDNHFCSNECKGEWLSNQHSGENNPNYSGRVSVTCEQCGDTINVAPCEQDDTRFCSVDCKAEFQSENRSGRDAHAWEGGPEINTCDQCGETYEVYSARAEESRFCSYECLGAARRVSMKGEQNPSWGGGKETLECEHCGDTYEVYPSEADDSRFCSYECIGAVHREERSGEGNARWRGGYQPYYGANWHQQRRRRVIMDQARCQDCGMTEAESKREYGAELEVHHIVPFRQFSTGEDADYDAANQLDNLISLCKSCHSQRENR